MVPNEMLNCIPHSAQTINSIAMERNRATTIICWENIYEAVFGTGIK